MTLRVKTQRTHSLLIHMNPAAEGGGGERVRRRERERGREGESKEDLDIMSLITYNVHYNVARSPSRGVIPVRLAVLTYGWCSSEEEAHMACLHDSTLTLNRCACFSLLSSPGVDSLAFPFFQSNTVTSTNETIRFAVLSREEPF